MNKNILTLGLSLLVTLCANTQPGLNWAKQVSGGPSEFGKFITSDISGNSYILGTFEETVDFNPGTGVYEMTANDESLFILKLDISGNFVWARQISEMYNANAKSIDVDSRGNIYVGGEFGDSLDFDPGPDTVMLNSKGNVDVFLLRLDAAGNFVWAKSFGGGYEDILYGCAIDKSDNIVLGGLFDRTADFDPSPAVYNLTSAGSSDVYIFKLDSSGEFSWAGQIGGASEDMCQAITLDDQGNIYTTGTFSGTVDFDPGLGIHNLTTSGLEDVFVCKLDESGNFSWAKNFGGVKEDAVTDIGVDGSGTVYAMGYFFETTDFDPGTAVHNITPSSFEDMYLLRLDPQGNFVWIKDIWSSLILTGNSIFVTTSGNVCITGDFDGSGDFDPGADSFKMSAKGDHDIFAMVLNPNGNLMWAAQMGGIGAYATGTSITVNSQSKLYITGGFADAVDFDPSAGNTEMISTEGSDVFVMQLDPQFTGMAHLVASSAINAYPNPVHDKLFIEGLTDNSDIHCKISNASGQLFPFCSFNPGEASIDISSLQTGIYILELNHNGVFYRIKIVKS